MMYYVCIMCVHNIYFLKFDRTFNLPESPIKFFKKYMLCTPFCTPMGEK